MAEKKRKFFILPFFPAPYSLFFVYALTRHVFNRNLVKLHRMDTLYDFRFSLLFCGVIFQCQLSHSVLRLPRVRNQLTSAEHNYAVQIGR